MKQDLFGMIPFIRLSFFCAPITIYAICIHHLHKNRPPPGRSTGSTTTTTIRRSSLPVCLKAKEEKKRKRVWHTHHEHVSAHMAN